jgi:hypothetical protein
MEVEQLKLLRGRVDPKTLAAEREERVVAQSDTLFRIDAKLFYRETRVLRSPVEEYPLCVPATVVSGYERRARLRRSRRRGLLESVESVKNVNVDSCPCGCQTVSPPSEFSSGASSPAGRSLIGLLGASCLNNSFINTPRWNLTFFLISCTSALCPSGLTAVTPLRSIMSSRPLRLSMASLHAVLNSATQGAMSLPSTISRHRRGPSTCEIFNGTPLPSPRESARIGPNVQAGRVEIGLLELVCVRAVLTADQAYSRRSMPNLFIRANRVVRFVPRRAAAP